MRQVANAIAGQVFAKKYGIQNIEPGSFAERFRSQARHQVAMPKDPADQQDHRPLQSCKNKVGLAALAKESHSWPAHRDCLRDAARGASDEHMRNTTPEHIAFVGIERQFAYRIQLQVAGLIPPFISNPWARGVLTETWSLQVEF